jgi:hypothetical protein
MDNWLHPFWYFTEKFKCMMISLPICAELMICSDTGSCDADTSTPAGDSSGDLNQPHDETKSSGPISISNSNYWRDVRASLVRREQVRCTYS